MSIQSYRDNLTNSRNNSPQRKRNNFPQNNSFNSMAEQMSNVNMDNSNLHSNSPSSPHHLNSINSNNFSLQTPNSLQQQNRKLRRKLKELSIRLDEQLQRAAQNKLKMQHLTHKLNHPNKSNTQQQSQQTLQLQNAYKMIERLQKSVKDFQNKESYQISVKRIMDLESIIKKKQTQIQQLRVEIKTNKKVIREKEKYIGQLLENSKKTTNVTEDKELIERMKKKIKKLAEDNQMLRKKELTKHQQLVTAERKIVQMEQGEELPIGREESLLTQLEDYKKKYKEAMQRVERQNVYITRLNQKIDKEGLYPQKQRKSQSNKDRRNISKSLQQLPSLNKKKVKPMNDFLDHLPSPKAHSRLKRY